MGGHALEHHRRRLLEIDRLGQPHQAVGGDQAGLGIAADRPCISDPVAHRDIGHPVAYGIDQAGAFHARGEWRR